MSQNRYEELAELLESTNSGSSYVLIVVDSPEVVFDVTTLKKEHLLSAIAGLQLTLSNLVNNTLKFAESSR